MSLSKHSYQWEHTENAYSVFSSMVRKYLPNNKDRLYKFFLQTPCYATEKYDGTNIAKDDQGRVYSRRYLLDNGQEEFIKTSLEKVKEADINKFKDGVVETSGLEPDSVNKCLVYGELMCNGFYDYRTRGIVGGWKVFGAVLEFKKELQENLDKVLKAGFAASKKNGNQIKLFSNDKFTEVANYAKLDTPDKKGENDSIANVIVKNKAAMKKGDLEGLILTIYEEEFGFKVVKWKAAHELQPASDENALKANDLVQSETVAEDLKTAFGSIKDVITDTSENRHMVRKKIKHKVNAEKTETSKKYHKTETSKKSQKQNFTQPSKSRYLSPTDKTIIEDGVIHSQKKFNSVEEYFKQGKIEEYKKILSKEVRIHLTE